MIHLSSTLLRDFERCPERARLKHERGAYEDADPVRSVPAAIGAGFDLCLRTRLAQELGREPPDEDKVLEWISPVLRPYARTYGRQLLTAYVQLGAFESLLREGVVDPDPARLWGRVTDAGFARFRDEKAARKQRVGYLISGRPDGYVAPSPTVADWKTTGILKGNGVMPGGYVLRFSPDGVRRGSMQENLQRVRPDWYVQLGTYASLLGTRQVGVDLVCGTKKGIEVARYRWALPEDYAHELKTRYLLAGRALERSSGPLPVEASPGRCHRWRRRCGEAETCEAYRRFEGCA